MLVRLQQLNENKNSTSAVLRFGNTRNKTYNVGDKLGKYTITTISADEHFSYDRSSAKSFIILSSDTAQYKIPYKGEFRIESNGELKAENSYFHSHLHLNKNVEKLS